MSGASTQGSRTNPAGSARARSEAPIACLNSPRCHHVFFSIHSLRQHYKCCRYSGAESQVVHSNSKKNNNNNNNKNQTDIANKKVILQQQGDSIPAQNEEPPILHLHIGGLAQHESESVTSIHSPTIAAEEATIAAEEDNESLDSDASSLSDNQPIQTYITTSGGNDGNNIYDDDSYFSCTSSNWTPSNRWRKEHDFDETCQSPALSQPSINGQVPPDAENDFVGAAASNPSLNISRDNMVYIKLLQLCDKLQVPQYGYDLILKWMHESFKNGYTFPARPPSRMNIMSRLHFILGIKEFSKPLVKTVPLSTPRVRVKSSLRHNQPIPAPSTVEVVTFPFQEMFESLISDPILMHSDNLLFDTESPIPILVPTARHDDELGDINSGDWFHTAHEQERCLATSDATEPVGSHTILCPLILFIDKTQVDKMSKWSLEPVLFTLGIFKRSARNLSSFWRPLGFIPDESLLPYKKSGHEVNGVCIFYFIIHCPFTTSLLFSPANSFLLESFQIQETKCIDYHKMLDAIFTDLRSWQPSPDGQARGIRTTINFKGARHYVLFKIPVAYIIGDCEGNDRLCGRYKSHNTKYLCRDCDCLSVAGDNPDTTCTPITQAIIQSKSKKELLSFCHYGVDNAFHKLWFGGDTDGIHGCSPPESLHVLQQGLYKYALSAFFLILNSRNTAIFERAAAEMSIQCKRQSDRTFPRITLKNGASSISYMTAREQTGLLLVCFLTLCSLDPACFSADVVLKKKLLDFRILFKDLLLLEYWIEADYHSRHFVSDDSRCLAYIKQFMYFYKATVNRQDGNGLKIPKFHQLLHIPRYILKYGSPKNFNSGRCESHHISLSKRPAKTAQKRAKVYEMQVASRISDRMLIARSVLSLEQQQQQKIDLLYGARDQIVVVLCRKCCAALHFT